MKDDELSEKELENVLGAAPKEVVEENIMEHANLFRPRSVEEIRREKEELLNQREELLNNSKRK